MAQIGLRGSGTAKSRDVRDALAFGSVLIRAEELHEAGVPAILRRLPAAARYHVSLDVAALDPGIAPGVETPAFGGLTYFEATNLLKGIVAWGLSSVSIWSGSRRRRICTDGRACSARA
jgi:agmatinase